VGLTMAVEEVTDGGSHDTTANVSTFLVHTYTAAYSACLYS
jgi:hypothetical protein